MDQNTINKVALGVRIFGIILGVVAAGGLIYSLFH